MTLVAALVLALLPGQGAAQGLRSERVDLHGFGGWSYGRTDVNRFLGADTLGRYAKADFAIKIGAAVHPTIHISAQLNWRIAYDGAETNLDYAFAQWQIADAVGLRAGKVKQPFGIYSEVAGIGTVRPFLNLPPAVYGPVGLVSRSYRGVGVRGSATLGSGWSASFDVYGGGIEFEQEESALETGYSSLSYLRRFPVNQIKVDRSFIRDIESDNEAVAITEAVALISNRLGIEVVAEGVATATQREILSGLGFGNMQGFLFSKAVPANELLALLKAQRDTRV